MASSTIKILDAEYEKVDLDAYLKSINLLDKKKNRLEVIIE
jgi:hypothetical protein